MSQPANPDAARQVLSRLLDAQGDRLYAMLARLALGGDVARELFQELFLRLGKSEGFAGAKEPAAVARLFASASLGS